VGNQPFPGYGDEALECILFINSRMFSIVHHVHIKAVYVAKQMWLLIHLMNSVLAYFHSGLHSDLFVVLHPYFTRF